MSKLRTVLICALVLGSCGPVPRPFQSEAGARNDLLVLEDRAGITVAALAGDLPADPDLLARAMAERLRDLNVPATTRAINGESRFLHGWATRRLASAAKGKLLIHWELWDLDGRLIGGYAQHWPDAEPARAGAGAGLIEALAADAAPKIAALVQAPPEVEARVPGFPGARLVVPPLGAGPGDSARSLARALRAELAAAGLPLAERQGPEDILVLGNVDLEPADDGLQEVTITWSVVSGRDRRDLGRVDQRNRVQAGSLGGAWGPLAETVARGAAQGVIDLLSRVPHS